MMAELPVSPDWVGQTYGRLEQECGVRIAYVTRFGQGQLTTPSSVVQEGDVVHAMLASDDADRAATAVARAPEGR
jgi:trk system potassium uptake protein